MFGLDMKGSPGPCHTPIRTPIKKEILSFTVSIYDRDYEIIMVQVESLWMGLE